jgi:hypothetical protein
MVVPSSCTVVKPFAHNSMVGGLNPATGIGGEKMVIKEKRKNNFFQIFDKTFFPAGACTIKLFTALIYRFL